MRHSLLLVCLAVLSAALSAGASRADNYGIDVFGKGEIGRGELGIQDGHLRLVPTSDGEEWQFGRKGEWTTVRANLGGGKYLYLTYDPTGKGKSVFLAPEPTEGSHWKSMSGGPGGKTFLAGQGKLAGWYLDIDPNGEKVKGKDGKEYTVYSLILSETPRLLERCSAFPIAP
jgi:hypothetical protein